MDRNEKFRRRLENKLNQPVKKEQTGLSQNFDPTPYVDIVIKKMEEKVEGLEEDEFQDFKREERKEEMQKLINAWHEKHNFTKEQTEMIAVEFSKIQKLKTIKNKKVLLIPFVIALAFVVIPPFFLPNVFQKMGWLSTDAGWITKIVVGIIIGIVFYYIAKTLFSSAIGYYFKKNKLL